MKKIKIFTLLSGVIILAATKALACGPPSLEGPSIVGHGEFANYYIDLSQVPNPDSYCIQVAWGSTGTGWELYSSNGIYATYVNTSPMNFVASGQVKATVVFKNSSCTTVIDTYNLVKNVTLLPPN